jgi:hypothetical protein
MTAFVGFYAKKGRDFSRPFLLFAQRSWQTRPVARNGRHPDQGEDNPNRKGVAGNGRV